MKKLFALLTALALMLSLASCGGQKSDPENDAENIQNEQTDSTEQEDTAPEETTPEEGAPEETEPETDGEQMPEEQPDEQPAPEEETPQAQEGITLSRTDFTLFTQGSTYRLKVTGAKDSPVFASSNPAVATVAEDGTVTAVGAGYFSDHGYRRGSHRHLRCAAAAGRTPPPRSRSKSRRSPLIIPPAILWICRPFMTT